MNALVAGIYARKSKITEKGDSIENQIKICKNYLSCHFTQAKDIILYEDYGYSGSNMKRPMFQKLLSDIQGKKIDLLICYRLDRISRNVVDFSNTLELMQQNGIDFVSISESFDTSSPMGRAMVYISSVFAQLERETIQERIKDNLLELAKTGKYLYATPPLGYTKKKVQFTDKEGNIKYYSLLESNTEESLLVQKIFKLYFTTGNIKEIEQYLSDHHILTRKGKNYSRTHIKRILSHPIYCISDAVAYDYFKALGCTFIDPIDQFNGEYGIYIYKKTESKNNSTTPAPPKKWLIGAGTHKGLIPSDQWIETQEKMAKTKNAPSAHRQVWGRYGLFTGLLKCDGCQSFMRPYSISGNRFYYVCTAKEKYGAETCSCENIRGDVLDDQIQVQLHEFMIHSLAEKQIDALLKTHIALAENSSKSLKQQHERNAVSMENLLTQLSMEKDPLLYEPIKNHLKKLAEENAALDKEIKKIAKKPCRKSTLTKEQLMEILSQNRQSPEDFIHKRKCLQQIIKSMTFDHTHIHITLK